MFNAQIRADFETLEVTINNYERMANAPEALERIKKLVEGLPQADNSAMPKLPTVEECYKVIPFPEDERGCAMFVAGIAECHKFIGRQLSA